MMMLIILSMYTTYVHSGSIPDEARNNTLTLGLLMPWTNEWAIGK